MCLSLSQLLETLSFGGVDDTSEEEEEAVVSAYSLMEMSCLLARRLYRNFSPRPLQQGFGLSAAVPPVIPLSYVCLLGDMQ